jgi:hypothetical protein
MTITRSDIGKQLEPGLNAIVGTEYNMVDNEHVKLFDTEKSNKSFEEEVMMSGLGQAPISAEGQALEYDDMQETYSARYNHIIVKLGFAITKEAIDDNLYTSVGKIKAKALGNAMAVTKQVLAANVFNRAFNSSFAGGDGVSLISNAHPTLSGNQSNLLTGDLSEAALEDAIISTGSTKDERGILIGCTAESVHIPVALQFVAEKILKSSLSTSVSTFGTDGVTSTNDINALKSMGTFRKGVHINHRFTDADAWFIRTSISNGTKMFQRTALEKGMEGDFDTDVMRYKAYERYAFGWTDWRNVLGSAGV